MNDKSLYSNAAEAIVKAQEAIIGPLAHDIADKVVGIDNPDKKVLGELVKRYESVFGQASVETCKDAIKSLLAKSEKDIDLPEILQ